MSELIRLIGILISLLTMVEASEAMIEPEPAPSIVTEIEYRSPCQEDEGWVTVDHRDPLSILDESVSRRCINLDEIAEYLADEGWGS